MTRFRILSITPDPDRRPATQAEEWAAFALMFARDVAVRLRRTK